MADHIDNPNDEEASTDSGEGAAWLAYARAIVAVDDAHKTAADAYRAWATLFAPQHVERLCGVFSKRMGIN